MKHIYAVAAVLILTGCNQAPEFGRISSNNDSHQQTIIIQTNQQQIDKANQLLQNAVLSDELRDTDIATETLQLLLKSDVTLTHPDRVKEIANLSLELLEQQLIESKKARITKLQSEIESLNNDLTTEVNLRAEFVERGDKFNARIAEVKQLYKKAIQIKESAKKQISAIGSTLSTSRKGSFNGVTQPLKDNFYASREKLTKSCHPSWWEEENKYKADAASFYLGEFNFNGTDVCSYYMVRKISHKFQSEKEIISDVRALFGAQRLSKVLDLAKTASEYRYKSDKYRQYSRRPSTDPMATDSYDVGEIARGGEDRRTTNLRKSLASSKQVLEQRKGEVIDEAFVKTTFRQLQGNTLRHEPIITGILASIEGERVTVDIGGRFKLSDRSSSHLVVIEQPGKRNPKFGIVNLEAFKDREEINILQTDLIPPKNYIKPYLDMAEKLRMEHSANHRI